MRHMLAALMGAVVLSWGVAGAEVTPDEIVQLAQKGVGEQVLLAAVEQAQGGFALSAEQIIKLKGAGVPESVIAAMLRKKPGTASAPVAIAAAQPAAAAGQGAINLENVDDRPWACRLDAAARILWFSAPGAGDEKVLSAHGGLTLTAGAGQYEARYVGERVGTPFGVQTNEKTLLLVSRVETDEFEGLYLSVFEKGERKGGGRLAVLRQTRAGKPQASYQYYEPPARDLRSAERLIERERVYVEPATTVVYRADPWYVPTYYPYSPYWSGYPYYSSWHRPYYYPWSCYGPRTGVGFGYRHGGHRSGWSVGFGVGW